MARKQQKAVALMSGGLDSCVAAMVAMQKYDVSALFAAYGQRTEARERRAFKEITDRLGIRRTLEIDLSYIKRIGGSSLTDPQQKVPELEPVKGIPSTYVPFRNGILLSAGVAWAESLGAKAVFIGAVAVDGPDGYPDTTREFFRAFEKAATIGTRPDTKIKIVAPLVNMNKLKVVRLGLKLGAPFGLTWSCYQSRSLACGRCLSCLGRMRAFEAAGVKDPISYKK